MKFNQVVQDICRLSNVPLTPQEIRDQIKANFPEHYRTPTHLRNIEKGHYKDADHALLAQIYISIRSNRHLYCDTNHKPMLVSWTEDAIVNTVSGKSRSTVSSYLELDYNGKIKDILENSERYHKAFYLAGTFSGPSLYFHRRAIETYLTPGSVNHIEYVYATLASWGMHRMGKGGAKMKGFNVFRKSMENLMDGLVIAQNYKPAELDEEKWKNLGKIFMGIEVMETSISLVGNSKVMHHFLPNVIPPIDREYTLRYLNSDTSIVSNLEQEWLYMRNIIEGFFIPLNSDNLFQQTAKTWLNRQDQYPWDTSPMKVIDNLIIGSVKTQLGE